MRGGAIDWLKDSLVDEGWWEQWEQWDQWDHLVPPSQTIWPTALMAALVQDIVISNAATGRFYWPFPLPDGDCRLLVQTISEIACNSSRPSLPCDDCLCP